MADLVFPQVTISWPGHDCPSIDQFEAAIYQLAGALRIAGIVQPMDIELRLATPDIHRQEVQLSVHRKAGAVADWSPVPIIITEDGPARSPQRTLAVQLHADVLAQLACMILLG